MLEDDIEEEEKISIVDHFCQQLINSGYCHDKAREIVLSGLKGIQRKESGRKEIKNKNKG